MLVDFVRAITRNDQARVSARLAGPPELALARLDVGATRYDAESYFLHEIQHYVYVGDSALHIAAAAYQTAVARELLDAGAAIAAENRRGAQPLHYAVDGIPGCAHWDPVAQRDTVACLVERGADPNAVDANGTTPPHRAGAQSMCGGRRGSARRGRGPAGHQPARIHLDAARDLDDRTRRQRIA